MPVFIECNPLKEFVVLATNSHFSDPAIDHADYDEDNGGEGAKRLETYRRTRDLSALRFRAGVRPTQFIVQRLPAISHSAFTQMGVTASRVEAFCTAVHRVLRGDGSEVSASSSILVPVAFGDESTFKQAKPTQWLKTIRDIFGMGTVYEIGEIAVVHAGLPLDKRGPYGYAAG